MRRILWTFGMGLAGLFLGLKSQDVPSDAWFTALSTIWAAGIGFGLASILNEQAPTKRVVIYWTGTLALVAPVFVLMVDAGMHPNSSDARQTLLGIFGALVGAMLGLMFGTFRLRRLRRGTYYGCPWQGNNWQLTTNH